VTFGALKLSWIPLVFGLLFTGTAPSQTRSVVPPREDIEVYFSFFNFHDDFAQWLDKRKGEAPERAQKLEKGAADHLRVGISELPIVKQISGTVVFDLGRLSHDAQAYIDKSKNSRTPPDRATLLGFEARRRQIVLSGVDRLKRALPPSAWNGLHAFINEEHRLSLHQGGPPIASPR
jgi:hypothetical protein